MQRQSVFEWLEDRVRRCLGDEEREAHSSDLRQCTEVMEQQLSDESRLWDSKNGRPCHSDNIKNGPAMRRPMMRISDHVVLRYMQRRLGFDVDAVRQQIEATFNSRKMREIVEFAGDVPWRVRAGGMVYCVRDRTRDHLL